jgi:hypothetical protein
VHTDYRRDTYQYDAVFLFATLVPAEMKRAKGKITEWTLHPLSVGAQRDDPKATCEWKVTATTPRRRQFGPRLLYDHRRAASGAKLGRRKQESNFLVTINPNKRRSPDLKATAAIGDAIASAVRHVFSEHRLPNLLKFGPVYTDYRRDKYDDVVESVRVRAAVELGPVSCAPHAHVSLRIAHWSQIHIKKLALQEAFKRSYNACLRRGSRREARQLEMTPGALPHVQIKLLAQSEFDKVIAAYVFKHLAPRR